jgi:hypothetical protein
MSIVLLLRLLVVDVDLHSESAFALESQLLLSQHVLTDLPGVVLVLVLELQLLSSQPALTDLVGVVLVLVLEFRLLS